MDGSERDIRKRRGQRIGGRLARREKPRRWRQPGRLRIEADPVRRERLEGSEEAWEQWTQEGSRGRRGHIKSAVRENRSVWP